MNLFGSYRALLGNSISAMCAALEMYNKPKFEYRDETAVILLVNAWELMLKSILSRYRKRIYYPKRRNQPYRTLSASDVLTKARPHFPAAVDFEATAANLELLIEYRDTAVHFYHKEGLEPVLYTLAQTAVVNFRDLVKAVFDRDLAAEVSLSLLPLAFSPPLEPVEFLRGAPGRPELSAHVREFVEKVVKTVQRLEDAGADTGRLLTIFEVSLLSTKKIAKADLVVGVQGDAGGGQAALVHKRTDPNKSHPHFRRDIITSKTNPAKLGMGISYDGLPLGQYEFEAIAAVHEAKSKDEWCWQDASGAVTRYSPQYITFLKNLSRADVTKAVRLYRERRAG